MAVLKNVLIGLDQTLNCLIKLKGDGWGKPDETLSARAWRLRGSYPRLYRFIDSVFFWDTDHCIESYKSELLRKQLPPSYNE